MNGSQSKGGILLQFNVTGLIVLSLVLVMSSALVTYGLIETRSGGDGEKTKDLPASLQRSVSSSIAVEEKNPPPWGQFLTRSIDLEQPEEYLAYETATNKIETWTFEGMTPEQVRSLMQSCGVVANEIDRALSPPLLSVAGLNTVIAPDDELVFSLTPQARAKFYDALGHYGSNQFMQFPFCLVGDNPDAKLADSQVSDTVMSSLRKLLYPRGNAECFSDLEILLRRVPSENERMNLLKTLSRQSAVMVRVRIWPDTDVDKLIGYWGRGIQEKDIRPLLESFKRLPEGASISLLYLLPPFARQRLYTYPEPSQPNDPAEDCHWSTMNFFNATPDNRFSDPKYTVAYLKANYYKIGEPTAYGDIILLLNKDGNAIHSAIYLADDIVFTKNGNNFAQPWMLMHLKDLVAEFTTDVPPSVAVYRNKNR